MSSSKLTAKTSLPGFFPLKTSRKHSITSRQASDNYITNITFRQSHYKAVRLLVTFSATICHAGNQIIHLAAHKTNNIHGLSLSGTKSKLHCQGKIIDKRGDNSSPKMKCILLFCHAEKMPMRDEEIPWVMVKGSGPVTCTLWRPDEVTGSCKVCSALISKSKRYWPSVDKMAGFVDQFSTITSKANTSMNYKLEQTF